MQRRSSADSYTAHTCYTSVTDRMARLKAETEHERLVSRGAHGSVDGLRRTIARALAVFAPAKRVDRPDR